jgi:hypothetical protein
VVTQGRIRRLHKAFLRYHDPENWPLLRDALKEMGLEDLIGNSKKHLIPSFQPAGTGRRYGAERPATREEGGAPGKAAPASREERPPRASREAPRPQVPSRPPRRDEPAPPLAAKPPRRGAGRGKPVAETPTQPAGRRGRPRGGKPGR